MHLPDLIKNQGRGKICKSPEGTVFAGQAELLETDITNFWWRFWRSPCDPGLPPETGPGPGSVPAGEV